MRCTLPTELLATSEHICIERALVYPTTSVFVIDVLDKPGVG